MSGVAFLLACGDGPTPPDAGRYEVSFDNGHDILTADPETMQLRIVRPSNESSFDASWSPDGQRIADTNVDVGVVVVNVQTGIREGELGDPA